MVTQQATPTAEEQWRAFAASVLERYALFFDGRGTIIGARAPGRLDILGGIADYAGSAVLDGTLAAATLVAVQARCDTSLRLRSPGAGDVGCCGETSIPLSALMEGRTPRSFADVAAVFSASRDGRWAAYVAGCLHVLMASGWLDPGRATGLNVLIESTVPMGAGVSSSAALEVAVMTALATHFDLRIDGLETARLCQIVENRIVGAPCGMMGQVACALGRENALLAVTCQPHKVLGHQSIPPGWRFVGLDSGVKHADAHRNYLRARTAAFMGLKILQVVSRQGDGGYLSSVSPDAWHAWRERIPETLTGADFTHRYGALPDVTATPDPADCYRVRACAEHPILENNRVREFIALTELAHSERNGAPDPQVLAEAGLLLLESHASYSERMRLGSPETDLLVDLIMERGPDNGLYGAKITGGGSGGTVVVLCAGPRADAALEQVRRHYARVVGVIPRLLVGSSPGAATFGARRIAGS